MTVRISLPLLALTLLAACSTRYNHVSDGDYLCVSEVVSTTCGPELPASESVVFITGGGNLSTDPLGLPFPLDPERTGGGSVQFGPQDEGFTYSVGGYRACNDLGGGYETLELHILVDHGESHVDMRVIQEFEGLDACGFPGVEVDSCRAERFVECDLIE